MFVDNVEINVRAGNGGSGLASFRREKFLPFGGPDGGDGGKGGDIYITADADIEDLASFKHRTLFQAGNGGRGGKNRKHGVNAKDLVIRVPTGTSAYVKQDGVEKLVADLQEKGAKLLLVRGGKGGKGNVHYATATRKAPEIFQTGEDGEQHDIVLRLKLLTDVCVMGGPNSGKSALLAAISAARPEIADYPFTTWRPVLGIVDDGVHKYIWEELPALVKGSSQGKGLGNRFLIHATRARVILYLLDAGYPDMDEEFGRLREEITAFDAGLSEKKSVAVINKIELMKDPAALDYVIKRLEAMGLPVFTISVAEKNGINELVAAVHRLVDEHNKSTDDEMGPEMVFRPKPVDLRG